MPAWGGTAVPLEGAERAFQERADLAEPAQGDLAAGGVPIGGHGVMFNIGSIKAYLIRQAKPAVRRIKDGIGTGKDLETQKTTSGGRDLPGFSTRRISNSERLGHASRIAYRASLPGPLRLRVDLGGDGGDITNCDILAKAQAFQAGRARRFPTQIRNACVKTLFALSSAVRILRSRGFHAKQISRRRLSRTAIFNSRAPSRASSTPATLGKTAATPPVPIARATSGKDAHSTSIITSSRFFRAMAESSFRKVPSPSRVARGGASSAFAPVPALRKP